MIGCRIWSGMVSNKFQLKWTIRNLPTKHATELKMNQELCVCVCGFGKVPTTCLAFNQMVIQTKYTGTVTYHIPLVLSHLRLLFSPSHTHFVVIKYNKLRDMSANSRQKKFVFAFNQRRQQEKKKKHTHIHS